MKARWLAIVLGLFVAVPAVAGVNRYRFVAKDISGHPTAKIPQFVVADTEAELPTADVREGDVAYTKDSDKFWSRTASAWTAVTGSGGGGGVSDGDKGDVTVTSSGATWTIDAATISNAKLRDAAGVSVVGRSANSTGSVADIAAGVDGDVLRRASGALAWGAIPEASVTGLVADLAAKATPADITAAVSAHAVAADPHTGYQKESEKGATSGYASLDGSTLVPVAQLPTATTSTRGAVELATDGESASGVAVQGNDARMSNARTPTNHASSHQDGGGDEVAVTGLSGLLADAQRVTVRKNTGSDVGTRARLNLIEGANVTLTVTDDGAGGEIDITIAAAGGGGGSGNFVEVSLAMTSGAGYYSTAVTGQTWVSGTSKVTCSPFGTTADGITPEQVAIADLNVSVHTLVAGTGFTLAVRNPTGSHGTHRFHCTGA